MFLEIKCKLQTLELLMAIVSDKITHFLQMIFLFMFVSVSVS